MFLSFYSLPLFGYFDKLKVGVNLTAVFNRTDVHYIIKVMDKNIKKNNPVFLSIFASLLAISIIFTDLPIFRSLPSLLTKSPMLFIAPVIFCLLLVMGGLKIELSEIGKYFFLYALITIISGSVILIIYVISTGNIYSPFGDLLWIDLLKAATHNIIFFLAYYSLFYTVKHLGKNKFDKYIFALLFIYLTAGIIEFFKPGSLNFLLFYQNGPRLQLLASEPSQSALVLTILAGLALIKTKNLTAKILIMFLFLAIFPLILSKGAIIYLIASLAIVYFFSASKKLKIVLLPVILAVAIAGIIFTKKILPHFLFSEDFNTRITCQIASLKSLFFYPFGEGYGTYRIFLPKLLLSSFNFLQGLIRIPLPHSEITDMVKTGINLSAKSGIFQQFILNGIFALMFFFIIFKRSFNFISKSNETDINKFIYKTLLLYILFSLTGSVNMSVMYAYLLPIVLLEKDYVETYKNNPRQVLCVSK